MALLLERVCHPDHLGPTAYRRFSPPPNPVMDGITSSGDGADENVRIAIDRTELTMKNRVAILAGVVWHQYANLVFSMH